MTDAWRRRLVIIGIWLATKVLVLGVVAAAHWQRIQDDGWAAYLDVWRQWDTHWFESIAVYGYVGPYVSAFQDFHYNIAFFPGFPAFLVAGTWAGIAPVATGLAVSAVASLIAAFGIARLTEDAGGRGQWGVVALLVAPTALFLTAAYTEALFCAFAFWAWAVAKRGSWVWAGVLAGGAALVRSNGLFLMAGLLVMFLLTRPWSTPTPLRTWLRGSALLLPLVSTLGYFTYLHAITGSWTAWSDAQRDFWDRYTVDPWTSLKNTYDLIWTFSPTGEPSSRMVTEIIAMAVILAFVAVLATRRQWPEAAYLLVTAAALGTSTMYHSVPRTLVVLFPIWVLAGVWMTRHRWLRVTYIAVGLPFLLYVAIRFSQEQWIS